MTITLACNRKLQMNRMVENSIASEPLCGSRNNINQSKVALEWLSWQEHLLQKQAYMDIAKDHKAYDLMALAYNDSIHPIYQTHIQHAGNVREFKIAESQYFVNGYDAFSNTVYNLLLNC